MNDSDQKTVPNIPAPFLNAVLGSGPWTKDIPHQPEHLYAKGPCQDCQAKQATIDKLRTALAGIMGGEDTARLDHIEALFYYRGIDFTINRERGMEAVRALRETMP